MATESNRHKLGEAALSAITGGTGTTLVESLKDIAPDLAEWIIIVLVSAMYGAPWLGQTITSVRNLAALTAMGTATPQLRCISMAALNVGC